MNEIMFILAQIFAFLGWFFLLYSYYKEDIQKLLRIQILAAIFDTLSYVLLGGQAGALICGFELLKAVLYYKTDKDKLIFLFTLPIYGLIAWSSCQDEGLIALLPVLGSIIDGYVLTRNKTIATVGSIVASILWIIYDIVILAYSAALTDSILVISNIFVLFLGYSRILHIDKLHVIRCRYLSRHICSNIIALDRDIYSEEYLWSIDQQRDIFNVNPDSIMLIRDKKKTIGYLNYIVITEEKYNQIKRAYTYYGSLNTADVLQLRKRRKNYMLIESIVVEKSYESKKMMNFIQNRFRIYLRNKRKQGYNIHGILSVGVSDFEKDLLKASTFEHIKDYRNKEQLYELSGINIARYIS
ncbi:YgjV family protein [Candidatus Saccharibacteria bacterium]|nr:YgjV family protein [Candidatus Saccharibacteria bacterium]